MRDHNEREGSAGSATFFTLYLHGWEYEITGGLLVRYEMNLSSEVCLEGLEAPLRVVSYSKLDRG